VTIERLIHPMTYLSIPVSGMLFLIEWVPASVRPYLLLFPLPHIIEFVREGEFRMLNSPYINLPYVIAICAIQTVIGITALRIVRRQMDM
jgi:capsular polysaccharide transport system permease protein